MIANERRWRLSSLVDSILFFVLHHYNVERGADTNLQQQKEASSRSSSGSSRAGLTHPGGDRKWELYVMEC